MINKLQYEYSNNKIIPFKEKKSKFILVNNSETEIAITKLDCSQLNLDGLKCDYFFYKVLSPEFSFLELKGSKVEHALNQVENSLKILGLNNKTKRKNAFIVSTRCPLTATELQRKQLKFRRSYNTKLIVNKTPLTYSI
jgi:hypothetical protein